MDSFSLKSCFIFNPHLKPNKPKPTDEECQDAKLLIYYPSSEEDLIKRSNIGIIEGTIDFIGTFTIDDNNNKKPNKLFFTELDRKYFIARKFEEQFYLTLVLAKVESGFNFSENMIFKKKWLKRLIKNFYNLLYLFHSDLHSIFSDLNTIDKRNDNEKYQNLIAKFSDFISGYFEYYSNIPSPFLDAILYLKSELSPNNNQLNALPQTNINNNINYLGIVYNVLRLQEKVPQLYQIAISYKGRIVYNEIHTKTLSLIYNMFINNSNGKMKLDLFRKPLFTDEMKEMTSPFNKAFEINEDINSGYYIGLDTSIKDSDINNIFLPSIYLKETNENVKLCCYKHYNMLFFIFLNETIHNDTSWYNVLNNISYYINTFFEIDLLTLKTIYNTFQYEYSNNPNLHFAYYNIDNHSFCISKYFYDIKTNYTTLEPIKAELLNKIYEIMFDPTSIASITKYKNEYIYYIPSFEKKICIILKEEKPIEDVVAEYLQKVLCIIGYL
jgi:hypothetical protein